MHRISRSGPGVRSVLLAGSLLVFSVACTTGRVGDEPAATAGAGNASVASGGNSNSGAPGQGGLSSTTPTAGSGGSAAMQPVPTTPDALAKACAANNGVLNVGVTRLRRLTRAQLDNTVRDLLGVSGQPSSAIAPDERIGPFHSNAIAPITDLIVEQHKEVAATLAAQAKPRMRELAGCDLASGSSCVAQFVKEFGARAYRRPLDAEESQKYSALFELGAQNGGVENGFRLVLEALLQAPSFLYHADAGESGTPSAKPAAVTGYELASRLSYFLWNTMPDAELFELAANGTIATPSVLENQVQRMLTHDRAQQTLSLFHRQWLSLEDLPTRDKDTKAYPQYNAALSEAMLQETAWFADYVVRRGDGLLKTLLTSNVAFPSGALFGVYGVSQPAGFQAGSLITLDATRRAGILTQAAFLTRHAHRDQTSPVHRGITVRENLLCQNIQAPPNNANTTPPPVSAATTTRERYAQHVADPACSSCHLLMDPIGLMFEHYDAVGAFRDQDGLGAVDASGEVHAGGSALSGVTRGAVELAQKLGQSPEVADCVANQWFRFSLGRMESSSDACSIQAIRQGFRDSGGNIRTLLVKIATSEAFRSVRASEP